MLIIRDPGGFAKCFVFGVVINLYNIANAIVSTDTFLPYLESQNATVWNFTDDSVQSVDLGFPFRYFGKTYTSAYIGSNGILTFSKGSTTTWIGNSTCKGIDTTFPAPTISVFWSDVIPRPNSRISYFATEDPILLEKLAPDISSFSERQISLTGVFVATWDNVSYYQSSSDPTERNIFQVILTTDGQRSFVLFYYNKLDWPMASYSAQASTGFIDNDGKLRNLLDGSCKPEIKQHLLQNSNIGSAGKWVFQVDYGLSDASRSYEHKRNLNSSTKIVRLLGKGGWLIKDKSFELDNGHVSATVSCMYNRLNVSYTTNGIIMSNDEILCKIPLLSTLGVYTTTIVVNLEFSNGQKIISKYVTSLVAIKDEDTDELADVAVEILNGQSFVLHANWDSSRLKMDFIESRFNISQNETTIRLLKYDAVEGWPDLGNITQPLQNTGIYKGSFDSAHVKRQTDNSSFAIVVQRKIDIGTNFSLEKQLIVPQGQILDLENKLRYNEIFLEHDFKCKDWYDKEKFANETSANFEENQPPLPCPPSIEQAKLDWRFLSANAATTNLKIQNSSASFVFTQSISTSSNQYITQCHYDSDGNPIIGYPNGHRLIRVLPNNNWNYYLEDQEPYLSCCKWSVNRAENCAKYFFRKRTHNLFASTYTFPIYSAAYGTGRIRSFGGVNYELNGITGEFWLINSSFFKLQVRLEWNSDSNSTMISAVACEEQSNTDSVLITVNSKNKTLSTKVGANAKQYFKLETNDDSNLKRFHLNIGTVNIYKPPDQSLILSFASGFVVNVTWDGNQCQWLSAAVLASPELVSKARGLMVYPSDSDALFFTTELGKNYKVLKSETAFLYNSGESWDTYDRNLTLWKPRQPANEQLQSAPWEAVSLCGGFAECVRDYALTKNVTFALMTKRVSKNLLKIKQIKAQAYAKHCDYPNIPPLSYVYVSSLLNLTLGQKIQITCDKDLVLFSAKHEIISGTFRCQQTMDGKLEWISVDSNETLDNHISCLNRKTLEKFQSQKEELIVEPKFVSVFGNVPLILRGPALIKTPVSVKCLFREADDYVKESTGILLSREQILAICQVPFLSAIGRITFSLQLTYEFHSKELLSGTLYSVKESDVDLKYFAKINTHEIQPIQNVSLHVSYNSSRFKQTFMESDVSKHFAHSWKDLCELVIFGYDGNQWNDGDVIGNISKIETEDFNLSVSTEEILDIVRHNQLVAIGIRETLLTTSGDNITLVTFQQMKETLWLIHNLTMSTVSSQTNSSYTTDECNHWLETDQSSTTSTISCPTTVTQAKQDWKFLQDDFSPNIAITDDNPVSFTQAVSSMSGTGVQCLYDANGNLSNLSHVQRHSSNFWRDHWSYYWTDAAPFMYCCQLNDPLTTSCDDFFIRRKSEDGMNYLPPKFAMIVSTGKIFPFDEAMVVPRLNYVGEFWALKYRNEIHVSRKRTIATSFKLQVRVEQYKNVEGHPKTIPVVTGLAIMDSVNNKNFAIQISRDGNRFQAQINNKQPILLDIGYGNSSYKNVQNETFYFDQATLKYTPSTSRLLATFYSGFSVLISLAGNNEMGFNIIVSATEQLFNTSLGLLAGKPLIRDLVRDDQMNKWRVHEEESIFVYQTEKSYSFYNRADVLLRIPSILNVRLISGTTNPILEGIMDFLATGSESIANSTRDIHKEFASLAGLSTIKLFV